VEEKLGGGLFAGACQKYDKDQCAEQGIASGGVLVLAGSKNLEGSKSVGDSKKGRQRPCLTCSQGGDCLWEKESRLVRGLRGRGKATQVQGRGKGGGTVGGEVSNRVEKEKKGVLLGALQKIQGVTRSKKGESAQKKRGVRSKKQGVGSPGGEGALPNKVKKRSWQGGFKLPSKGAAVEGGAE